MLALGVHCEHSTAISLKNVSALWNFYCFPTNIFVLFILGYGAMDKKLSGEKIENANPQTPIKMINLQNLHVTSSCGTANGMERKDYHYLQE